MNGAITLTSSEGAEINGWVRMTFPYPQDDGGLVIVEISANVLNEGGLEPGFWDEAKEVEPDIIERCPRKGDSFDELPEEVQQDIRIEIWNCHLNNFLRGFRAVFN